MAAINQDDDDDPDAEGELDLQVSEIGPHGEGEEHTYTEGNWEGGDHEHGGYDGSGELRSSVRSRPHSVGCTTPHSIPYARMPAHRPLTHFTFDFHLRPI